MVAVGGSLDSGASDGLRPAAFRGQPCPRPRRRPDPDRHLLRFASWEISSKANKWLGLNLDRWRSDEYDKTYKAAEVELDPAKRAALLIKLNDLVCGDGYVIPLLFRPSVTGLAKNVVAPLSGWDNDMAAIHEWYRET